jgi:hypothetical protein
MRPEKAGSGASAGLVRTSDNARQAATPCADGIGVPRRVSGAPPVNPDHDIEEPEPVRQAGERRELGGIEAPNPSPDRVLYDENRAPG